MSKTRKSRPRAPGMTRISISPRADLVEKINQLADAENRNRSNYIATVMEGLAKQRPGEERCA